jgi:hypothetical protein
MLQDALPLAYPQKAMSAGYLSLIVFSREDEQLNTAPQHDGMQALKHSELAQQTLI